MPWSVSSSLGKPIQLKSSTSSLAIFLLLLFRIQSGQIYNDQDVFVALKQVSEVYSDPLKWYADD